MRFLPLSLLSFFFCPKLYSQYQTEGVIKTISTYINTYQRFDSTLLEIPVEEKGKIWFKDSCIIYELKIHLKSSEPTLQGQVVQESFVPWRYIYLDLKTMRCQDYSNFKDTAMLWCNYTLKPDDTVGIWRFYAPKAITDTAPGMFYLSDTTIDNIVFKRVKVLYKYYPFVKNYSIYYLDCNAPQNMIWLNRTVSQIYSGCKATRVDGFDDNNRLMGRFEYEVIKDKLTKEEENIFKRWSENAENTKLPLLSQTETRQITIPSPKHENPTITVEKLNRNH